MQAPGEFSIELVKSIKSKPTSLVISPDHTDKAPYDFEVDKRDFYVIEGSSSADNSYNYSTRVYNARDLPRNFLHHVFRLIFTGEIESAFLCSLNPNVCKLALNVSRKIPHTINSKDMTSESRLYSTVFTAIEEIISTGSKIICLYLNEFTTKIIREASSKYPDISFLQFYEDGISRGMKSWDINYPNEEFDPVTRNRIFNPTPSFKAQLREFLINNVSRSVTIRDLSGNIIYPIIKGNGFHYHNEINPLILNMAYANRDNIAELKSRAWESTNERFLYISLDEEISEDIRLSIPGTYVYRKDGFDICTSIRDCPRITFIIATTGRRSVDRAMRSISDQDPFRYFPILMLSDIEPANGNELGRTSGLTRNKALDLIKSGWVSFLDDDDELAPGSVHKLYDYMNDYDMIVPRALYENGQILWSEPKMLGGNVGIWIFYNKTKFPDNRFPQGVYEDFRFVQSIEFAKAKILFLDEITYLVRPSFH